MGAFFVPEAEKQSEGGKSNTIAAAMPEIFKVDAISSDIIYDSKVCKERMKERPFHREPGIHCHHCNSHLYPLSAWLSF